MAGKRRSQRGQSRESVSETAPAREPQKSWIGAPCQEPSSMAHHRGQQSLPMGGEGRTNSVPPMQEALVALAAPSEADEGEIRRARVQARAAQVDHTDKDARIDFCKTLGPDYVKGETHELLMAVWGLADGTVNRDLRQAWREIRMARDPEAVRDAWWRDVDELLESAREDRSMVKEAASSMRGSLGPAELKFVSDALGRSIDSASKLLEMMGRAGGLIQSGSKVDIRVDVIDPGERKPRKADPVMVANAWSMAQAFFVEAHPELLQEFLAYCGAIDTVGEEV